jgi:hypothetical protein
MKNMVIDDSVAVCTRSPALATSGLSGIEPLERVWISNSFDPDLRSPAANLVGIGVT